MRIRSTVSVLLVSVLAAISLRATSLQDEQRYVVLHVPGFAQTIPWGVNDAGEAVGSAIKCIPDPQGGYPIYEYHGFAYQNGVYSLIDYPGALYMTPTAINSQGAIVGYLYSADSQLRAFTFDHGSFEFLSAPDVPYLVPQGINSRGDVIGWFYSGGYRAFVIRDGTFTLLTPPGAVSAQAWGINSPGTVVGFGSTSNFTIFSFSYSRGQYAAISVPGLVYGINDRNDLLAEINATPSTVIYRNRSPLNLRHPEPDYRILDLSNTEVVGALPGSPSANGCWEAQGFMLALP